MPFRKFTVKVGLQELKSYLVFVIGWNDLPHGFVWRSIYGFLRFLPAA